MHFFKKKAARVAAVVCVFVLAAVMACGAYLGDFYRADMQSIEAFAAASSIAPYQNGDGYLVFQPEEAHAGFIFYPGGKVEHTAYIPLMQSLADKGILCVLVEMPFHLAVLDVNAAEGIPEQFPETESWYIGGHSLGGSMAASYLSEHTAVFDGLVLLGSYSTADLSGTELSVLSVYGSEDLVMNREKYRQNRENLPEHFLEVVIDGGCHANFGMYGAQEGDGIPAISSQEQILLTAEAIAGMVAPDLYAPQS